MVPARPVPRQHPDGPLWPGQAYVDQVGLDGCNWAGHLPGTSWLPFADVFAQGLAELATLSALPVHVSETVSPETAPDGTGDKAAWITEMFAALRSDRRLAGVTWYHHRKELDWRITSSPGATEAFRAGMAG